MTHAGDQRTLIRIVVLTVGLALALSAAPDASAALVVYGSPTYTPGVGGFQGGFVPFAPGRGVNDSGVAIGYAGKYDASGTYLGDRAVRWDVAGTAATELGNLGTDANGVTYASANAVNSAGAAVGNAYKYDGSGTNLGFRAVRWDASGTAATELGNIGTSAIGVTDAYAYAVNSAGAAVGRADKYNGLGTYLGDRAVRWNASGTAATELGNLGTSAGGFTFARAHAVNSAGVAVGYAIKYDVSGTSLHERAVRWDASGTVATELGNLGLDIGGRTTAVAYAVNSAGAAVGNAYKYDGSGTFLGIKAVRWDASSTAATELGTLSSDATGFNFARADAVNSAGAAVGYAEKYNGSGTYLGRRAVRWDASGTAATELGNLGTNVGGVTNAYAAAVNSAGVAVGYAEKYNGSGTFLGPRAAAWLEDGFALELNMLIDPASGWTLQSATAISDTWFVSGVGVFDPDGPGGHAAYTRLFVMDISSAVPEPGALSLLSLPALILLRRARRGARAINDNNTLGREHA